MSAPETDRAAPLAETARDDPDDSRPSDARHHLVAAELPKLPGDERGRLGRS